MADRKKELKKSMEVGNSIVANKFANKFAKKDEATNKAEEKKDDPKAYKDAVNSWNKTKNMPFVQSSSLVANKFADGNNNVSNKKEEPTVKTDDTNIGFNGSALSDKTFDGKTPDFNVDFGTDNKKVGGPFDKTLDELDSITNENSEASNLINNITNSDTGEVDLDEAKKKLSEYQIQLIEKGHAGFDKDGKFVLKPVGKGWETWATLLSVGLSAVGLAMGVPIIPINFKAITGKDANDAERRSQQQQYLNILAENFNKIENMKSDVEAGKIAMENQDAITAQEKHAQATAAQKDIIDAQTKADMQKAEQAFAQSEKLQKMANEHSINMAELQSTFATQSAKELFAEQKYGWILDFVKEAKAANISDKDIAVKMCAMAGVTPNQMTIKTMTDVIKAAREGVETFDNHNKSVTSTATDLLNFNF